MFLLVAQPPAGYNFYLFNVNSHEEGKKRLEEAGWTVLHVEKLNDLYMPLSMVKRMPIGNGDLLMKVEQVLKVELDKGVRFPTDMLVHDQCRPVTEQDAHVLKMSMYQGNVKHKSLVYVVKDSMVPWSSRWSRQGVETSPSTREEAEDWAYDVKVSHGE